MGSSYCFTRVYDVSTLDTLLTGIGCSSRPGLLTVYDDFTIDGGLTYTPTLAAPSRVTVTGSKTGGVNPPSVPTPSPKSGGKTSAAPTASPSSNKLSGGAIGGIVVGAIFFVFLALCAFFLYRFATRRSRERRQQQQSFVGGAVPVQQTGPSGPSMGSPMPSGSFVPTVQSFHEHRPSNFTMPSDTPLVAPPQTELSPADSASQIGGYSSPASPGPSNTHTDSLSQSNLQSGLGPMPGPFIPVHQANQSVLSPGSAFGSMPPGYAPNTSETHHEYRPMGPQNNA